MVATPLFKKKLNFDRPIVIPVATDGDSTEDYFRESGQFN